MHLYMELGVSWRHNLYNYIGIQNMGWADLEIEFL